MKSSIEHKKSIQESEKGQKQIEANVNKGTVSRPKSKPRGVMRARDEQKVGSVENAQISIRQALPSDAEFASKLLFAALPHFTQYGIGMGKEERAKQILYKLFLQPRHRYSFEQVKIIEFCEKKAGLALILPGKTLKQLNSRFFRKLIASYPLKLKLKLIHRFLPFFFLNEGGRDDFVLNSLIVLHKYQNQAIGERLVKSLEKQARAEGYKRATTVIEFQNSQMRKFFEEQRYKVKNLVLESNKRVVLFGAGYQQLEKNL